MTSYVKRLYAKYCRHMKDMLHGQLMQEDEFSAMAVPALADMKLVEISELQSQGFIFYREWDDDHHHVSVPVFCYAADCKLYFALVIYTVTSFPLTNRKTIFPSL